MDTPQGKEACTHQIVVLPNSILGTALSPSYATLSWVPKDRTLHQHLQVTGRCSRCSDPHSFHLDENTCTRPYHCFQCGGPHISTHCPYNQDAQQLYNILARDGVTLHDINTQLGELQLPKTQLHAGHHYHHHPSQQHPHLHLLEQSSHRSRSP